MSRSDYEIARAYALVAATRRAQRVMWSVMLSGEWSPARAAGEIVEQALSELSDMALALDDGQERELLSLTKSRIRAICARRIDDEIEHLRKQRAMLEAEEPL